MKETERDEVTCSSTLRDDRLHKGERIEQSGPVGPSRFNYRDTKDRLRSNFTREIKKNQRLDEILSLSCFGNSGGKKREGRTRFFSLYRTRCTRIYADALRLPGTVCTGSGSFPVAGDAIDQEEDHADGSRVFTTVVRSVRFGFAHVEGCLYT